MVQLRGSITLSYYALAGPLSHSLIEAARIWRRVHPISPPRARGYSGPLAVAVWLDRVTPAAPTVPPARKRSRKASFRLRSLAPRRRRVKALTLRELTMTRAIHPGLLMPDPSRNR